MRWISWLLRQVSYAALAPIPDCIDSPVDEPAPGESADDCEAFLAGRLAEYRLARHQRVSKAEWTNLLAHGSEEDLMREVASADRRLGAWRGVGATGAWREARGSLAASLLSRAADQAALRSLQQAVVGPLEVQLSSDAARWDARRWLLEVEGALDRFGRGRLDPGDHDPTHRLEPPT